MRHKYDPDRPAYPNYLLLAVVISKLKDLVHASSGCPKFKVLVHWIDRDGPVKIIDDGWRWDVPSKEDMTKMEKWHKRCWWRDMAEKRLKQLNSPQGTESEPTPSVLKSLTSGQLTRMFDSFDEQTEAEWPDDDDTVHE